MGISSSEEEELNDSILGGGGGGKSPKALSYRNIGIGRVECMFL